MKILVVDDSVDWLTTITEQLQAIPNATVRIAQSRDSGIAALNADWYDLIICDLKIPTSDNELDTETEHGEAVIAYARGQHAGTPIVVLSAFGTPEYARDTAEDAARLDIVGDRLLNLLSVSRAKAEIGRAMEEFELFAGRLSETDGIEVSRGGDGGSLEAREARVIRILTRRFDGRRVEVRKMHGGLSQSSAFRISCTGGDGQQRGQAFVKVGPLATMRDERERFQRRVSLTLPIGSFASLADVVEGGAGSVGALSYQLADNAKSLTEVLVGDAKDSRTVITDLSTNVGRWYDGGLTRQISVREFCDAIGAPALSAVSQHVGGIDCAGVEAMRGGVKNAVQHCDLHLENLLVVPHLKPVLIDFGEVRDGFAGYDAVTLELSLLFHPAATQVRGTWPSLDQARKWDDVDVYVAGCPVIDFIKACREWAFRVSPSNFSVDASLYAYVLRQLSYDDTNKELARALLDGVVSRLVR